MLFYTKNLLYWPYWYWYIIYVISHTNFPCWVMNIKVKFYLWTWVLFHDLITRNVFERFDRVSKISERLNKVWEVQKASERFERFLRGLKDFWEVWKFWEARYVPRVSRSFFEVRLPVLRLICSRLERCEEGVFLIHAGSFVKELTSTEYD